MAYNGAIEQMERAFAARDRANASMRQFIADAGHQLRTPLTVVQGFIAILRRGGMESAPDRDRILDTMNDQSRIMGSLIDKLILLERWENVEVPERLLPIDVGRLVADLVSPIADAHPDRSFAIAAEPGVLAAIDPTELGLRRDESHRQRAQIRRRRYRRARLRARRLKPSSKLQIRVRGFRLPTRYAYSIVSIAERSATLPDRALVWRSSNARSNARTARSRSIQVRAARALR